MSDALTLAAPVRRGVPAVLARATGPGRAALLPLLAAAAYAVLLVPRIAGAGAAALHNSDALNSPLLGDSLGRGGAGTIWLPGDTFVNAIWFDAATRWLPGHRALWAWWPVALAGLTAVLVAVSVRRVAGRLAGWVGLGLGLAAPPIVLLNLLPQNFHVTTFANGALLGWFAVVVASGGLRDRRRLLAAALGLGLLTGLDAAADPLLVVTGLAPLLGTAALLRLRERGPGGGRLLLAGAALTAAAAVAMAATSALTAASGIAVLPAEGDGVHLAGLGRVGVNLGLAGSGLSRVAVGPLLGRTGGPGSAWAWPAALLLLGGAAVGVGLGARALVRPGGRHPGGVAGRAHVLHWTLTAGFCLGAFLLTTVPAGENAVRYLVPLFYAAAALVPLAVTAGSARGLAAGAAAAWVGLSAAGLATVPAAAYDSGPGAPDPATLVPFLEAHGLTRGYASFWDANALTWAANSRIEVRPVMQGAPCGDPGGRSLCAYHFNSADGWYDPRPVSRSFLLVHPGAACVSGAPDPATAAVVADYSVGGIEVVVVAGDLAAHLVRSRFALCPPGGGEAAIPVG